MQNEKESTKMRRLFIKSLPVTMSAYGIIGLGLILFNSKNENIDKLPDILGTILSAIGVIGIFTLMLNYLKKSDPNTSIPEKSNLEPRDIKNLFAKLEYILIDFDEKAEARKQEISELLKRQNSEVGSIDLTLEHKQELYNKVSESFNRNITNDFFNSIKEKVTHSLLSDKKEQLYNLLKTGESSIIRLKGEVEILAKRANLNLIIGSTISVAALILLGYFVVREDFDSNNIAKTTLNFLPRLSLVIFIEFFSFFFLKLYRASLNEIKYYQNELTNLEMKQTALYSSAHFGSAEDISNIIRELSQTERNFKLQKGESTCELEKSKLENQNIKEVFKSALNVISTQSKK